MSYLLQAFKIFFMSLRAGVQGIYGVYRLSRLHQPIVSIFGGSRAYEAGKYTQWAQETAALCAENNLSVITGGGPGIMEAANCGAYEMQKSKRWTLGVGIEGVHQEFVNRCAPKVMVSYFFIRKWLLIRYSCAFIFFPGGIGTADEFFELLNQINLGRLSKKPVILVGKNYWHHLIAWYDHAYERDLIPLPAEKVFVVTDDPAEAVALITRSVRAKS